MGSTHTTPTFESFAEYLILKDLAESTVEAYCIYFRIFPHDNFNQESVNQFLLKHTGDTPRGFVRNYLDYLKRRDIDMPKKTGRKKQRLAVIVPESNRAIVREALYNVNTKYGLMFDMTLQGGLRREELTTLELQNFEWDEWGKDTSKPCRVHIIGKGNKERIIVISPKLAMKIKNHFKNDILTRELRMDERMFGMDRHRWWEILKQASEGMLGKRIRPHELRSTRATQLWESGEFDLLDLQNFLGHADLSTTQIYLHPDKEKSLKKFEKFISEN